MSLRHFDHWLGQFVPCAARTITADTRVKAVGGSYSAEDWGAVYAADAVHCDSNDDWLQSILLHAPRKLQVALWLIQVFDFSKVKSIVEIGSGDLIAAAMIKRAYPHIDYHATDFDTDFAERTKGVPWLQALRLTTHDAKNGAVPPGDHTPDLVLGIGVEYVFTDDELTALFRSTTAPMLLPSASVIGPMTALWNKRPARGMKRHGFPRSVAKLRTIGQAAGRKATLLGQMPEHAAFLYT